MMSNIFSRKNKKGNFKVNIICKDEMLQGKRTKLEQIVKNMVKQGCSNSEIGAEIMFQLEAYVPVIIRRKKENVEIYVYDEE